MVAISGFYSHVRQEYMRLATRPRLALGLTLVASFMIAVGYTAQARFPLPRIHDEFSYILAGETFASGRVAFPPASSPGHFETIHELQRPTYVSKYPPAQGLALAIGIRLADSPRLGVWLSFAALGGALLWMLQAWAPPAWSLVAAWWTILLLGSTHWSYSYWGGAVPALGGALVFGALGRLGRARTRDAIVLALGVLVLANSRPFEGLLLCIPAAAYLLWWLARDREHTLGRRLTRVILPATLLLVIGGAGMLAYNQATTGDPLRPPYVVYEATKGGAPAFFWGKASALHANARVTDIDRWNDDIAHFERLQTVEGYSAEMWRRLKLTLGSHIPLLLAFPLLLLPWAARGPRSIAVAAALGLVGLGSAVVAWHEPHYFAPALSALVILYVRSLRTLDVAVARRWRSRRVVAGAVVVALFVVGGHRFTEPPRGSRTWASPNHWSRQRAEMQASLGRNGGRHVIFVRYLPSYASSIEWVYNPADRDSSKVLWANDLGDSANVELLKSAKDRQGWLLVLGDRKQKRALQLYLARDSTHLRESIAAAATTPATEPAASPMAAPSHSFSLAETSPITRGSATSASSTTTEDQSSSTNRDRAPR